MYETRQQSGHLCPRPACYICCCRRLTACHWGSRQMSSPLHTWQLLLWSQVRDSVVVGACVTVGFQAPDGHCLLGPRQKVHGQLSQLLHGKHHKIPEGSGSMWGRKRRKKCIRLEKITPFQHAISTNNTNKTEVFLAFAETCESEIKQCTTAAELLLIPLTWGN